MKIIFTLFLVSLSVLTVCSQNTSIEKNFEKNKSNFKITRFAFGEDASSGWDYLVYLQKTSTKKIRVIWSNYEKAEVEDYYYEAGKPLLFIKYPAKLSQSKTLARGTNLPLKAEARFYFTDSKLVTWIENGKQVPSNDSRWVDKEKVLIEMFNEQLENFRLHFKRGIIKIERKQMTDFSSINQMLPFFSALVGAEDQTCYL